MNGINSNLIVAMSCILCLVGCAKETSTQRATTTSITSAVILERDNGDWVVDSRLNGEPAILIGGGIAGEFDLTPFTTNGVNRVTIIARSGESAAALRAPCAIETLLRTYSGDGFNYKTLCDLGKSKVSRLGTIRAEHEFEAYIPVRWRWEHADKLVGLSDSDKSDIFTRFHRFVSALDSKDWKRARTYTVPFWAGVRPVPTWMNPELQKESYCDVLATTERLSDYGVYAPATEDIELSVGCRMVRMAPRNVGMTRWEPLVSIGHRGHGNRMNNDNIKIYALYFVHEEGNWEMMLKEWMTDPIVFACE